MRNFCNSLTIVMSAVVATATMFILVFEPFAGLLPGIASLHLSSRLILAAAAIGATMHALVTWAAPDTNLHTATGSGIMAIAIAVTAVWFFDPALAAG